MKNFAKLLWMAGLVALSSCMMEAPENGANPDDPKTDDGNVKTNIGLTVPGGFSMMETRALSVADEMTIDDATVLLLGTSDGLLKHKIAASAIEAGGAANKKELTATLPSGTYDLIVVANAASLMSSIDEGDSDAEITGALVGTISGKMPSAAGDVIPMWGRTDDQIISGSASPEVSLVRSVAKVDVGVGAFNGTTWDGLSGGVAIPFTMSGVYIVGANSKYQVIPTAANFDPSTNEATEPSVPTAASGNTQFTIAQSRDNFFYSGANLLREIYVPEAKIVGTAHGSRMAVIVKGEYTGPSGSGDDTFYRVDFYDGTTLKDVLRNVQYRFDISRVAGNGQTSIEDAYNSTSNNMIATVVEWGGGSLGNMVIRGDKFIGISDPSPIEMSSIATSSKTVRITTNIDNFTMESGGVQMTVANGAVSDGDYDNGKFNYLLDESASQPTTEGVSYDLTITTLAANTTADAWTIEASNIASLDFTVQQTAAATTYTVDTEATNGSAIADHTAATAGTTIEVLATPAAGYKFDGWSIPGVTYAAGYNASSNPTRFVMPAGAITAEALFDTAPAQTTAYTASGVAVPSNGGTISIDGGAASANPSKDVVAGVGVSYRAYAAAGWTFEGWSVSEGTTPYAFNSAANPTAFAMPSSLLTLDAAFDPIAYQVTTSVSPTAAGQSPYNVNPSDPTIYLDGNAVDISTDATSGNNSAATGDTTTPASYVFTGWTPVSGGSVGDSSEASTTFTLSGAANATATASYTPYYKVTISEGSGSDIVTTGTNASASMEAGGIAPGTEITFTASATGSDPLTSLTATGNGAELADLDSSLGTLRFRMPNSNVLVESVATPPYAVVKVNNTLWATTNLGMNGNFCAQPTDYGALYQWGFNNALDYVGGTSDGFHTSGFPSVWNGADGTANQGPCPTGWRLPTQGEISELLSRTYTTVSKTYSNVSGVGTLEFTTTSTDSTYPTKTLVFPDAGYRNTSGTVGTRGASGCDWLCTLEDTPAARPYRLSFHSGAASGALSNADLGYAFSVRCVRPVN